MQSAAFSVPLTIIGRGCLLHSDETLFSRLSKGSPERAYATRPILLSFSSDFTLVITKPFQNCTKIAIRPMDEDCIHP